MLPIIKLENARGEVLDLSSDPRYFAEASGIGPPEATINHSKIAVADGTKFNSATVNQRNLVLTITLLRDVGRARLNLYKFAASKAYVKVHYKTDEMNVWTEGYVETVEVNPWELAQVVQVSIICPYPFWQDHAETYTDASNIDALFEFPFTIDAAGVEISTLDVTASAVINNAGQVSSGARFEICATARCQQPRIYNMETGEWLGVNVDLLVGERLIIDTTQGQKSITHVVGGTRTNYINALVPGSTWLQLAAGLNEFTYTVEAGAITLGVYHVNKYQGV